VEPHLESAWGPDTITALAGLCLIVLGVFGPIILITGVTGQASLAVFAVLLALALVALAVAVPVVSTRASDKRTAEAWQEDHARWEAAMEKWSELYYCWRDDVVYLPGSPSAVLAASVWTVV
jgi:multidrug efflux pump subunit AcrB